MSNFKVRALIAKWRLITTNEGISGMIFGNMSGKGLGWKRACRGKARRRYCPLALEKRAGRKTKHKILSFTSYKACVIV